MKQYVCVLLLVFFFFVFCSPSVFAESLMEDLFSASSLEGMEDVLPSDLPLRTQLLEKLKSEEGLSSTDFFSQLISAFFASLATALFGDASLFAAMLALLLISSFFSAMRQAYFRDSVGDAVDFLSVLALSATAFSAMYQVFLTVREALYLVSAFLWGMLPITGAVYTLSGGVVTAGVQSSVMLTALSVLDAVCLSYLLPLFCASFALSAAGALSGGRVLPLAKFFRRTLVLCIGGTFTVLLGILSIQTLLSASADSMSLRTARFAAANFVPVVGGMFSESAKTVFSALSVLRSSVGALGIFSVLWLLLVPLVGLLVRKMLFSFLSAVASCFSLEKESVFLSECGETLGLLSSLVLLVGIFFILGFGVFAGVKIGG